MSKFRFEALLKIRETERNEKKEEFLATQRLLQEKQDFINSLEQELLQLQQESRTFRTSGNLSSLDLQQIQNYQKSLKSKIQEEQEKLNELSIESDRRRDELNEAIKEVKILETLKRKTEERRLEEERRRSDREMDDLATQQKTLERQKTRDNS